MAGRRGLRVVRRAAIEAVGMLACASFGAGVAWLLVLLLGLPDPNGATNVFGLLVALVTTFVSWGVLRKRLRR